MNRNKNLDTENIIAVIKEEGVVGEGTWVKGTS